MSWKTGEGEITHISAVYRRCAWPLCPSKPMRYGTADRLGREPLRIYCSDECTRLVVKRIRVLRRWIQRLEAQLVHVPPTGKDAKRIRQCIRLARWELAGLHAEG